MTLPRDNPLPVGDADTFGLMFCLQANGSYAAAEHGDLMMFEYNGVAISNPCCDESSTVSVDPRYYGFDAIPGPQAAFRRGLAGGDYLLLTELEGAQSGRLSRCDAAGRVLAYCYLQDVP